MSTKIRYARASALPAIAAALALSSTPLLGQQVQPAPAAPPPSTATMPSTDSTPASSDTAAVSPTTADTSATATGTAADAAPAAKPVRHVAHAGARHPAKAVTHGAIRTTSTHAARSVAAAAPAAAVTRPAPASAAAPQSAVQPIVSMTTPPAQSSTAARAPVSNRDETVPIAAGGVLGLLIAGGAAFALTRRRREDEADWMDDESIGNEPAEPADEHREDAAMYEEQPAIVAPPVSAFAWGNRDDGADRSHSDEPLVEEERHPGESWIERAYRGPSPSNPSVSLRTRLKRAAFFDKRERQAAAGLAEPVDPAAGLPEAMIDEGESELA